MLESPVLLFALLPLAAASGWYLAKRKPVIPSLDERRVSNDYLQGLQHLVNEDPDKAIQVFVRMLEVDNETVEIHLALGNLFRRQGEVDRALRIHQNLVARPALSAEHRWQARFELARDYLRAGMLDRAEELLKELVELGMFQDQTLAGLISIYEQERDWQRAIEMTRRLESVRGSSMRPVIAQYHCELAEVERRRQELRAASDYLRKALEEFRDCVRASLMLGEIEEAAGNHETAARHYLRVPEQDAEFIGEVLEPLERCYERMGQLDAWRATLEEMATVHQGTAASIAMARLLVKQDNPQGAIDYLAQAVEKTPSWVGFHHLLELSRTDAHDQLPVQELRQALRQVIMASPRYQCVHCGFSGKTLYWQCPGCRQWNSVTPLKDVIPKAA